MNFKTVITGSLIAVIGAAAISVTPGLAKSCGGNGYVFTSHEKEVCVTVDDVKNVEQEYQDFFKGID